jgi:hypothetical protein
MSPIDHLIVTVIGSRRAQAREQRPAPDPVPARTGRPEPPPTPGRRPATSGNP